jgi:type I restriction enzyme S subunit
MALCDRLEAAQADRETRRDRFGAVSHQWLTSSSAVQDPRVASAFWVKHLPALATGPRLDEFRQTILDLAVRGGLLATKQPDEMLDDGAELPLPHGWRHTTLGELLSEDSQNGLSRKPDDDPTGVPILRISAGTVRRDGIVAEEEFKYIGGITAREREQFGLRRGDLLACRFNGNRRFVGRLSEYRDYLGLKHVYPDKLIRLRLRPDLALPALVRYFAESDLVRAEVERHCATTVGNWGISATNLKTIVLPLPSLAEQRRLVAKLDELMLLCDRLEVQIAAGETTSSRLLDALLHEALASPSPELADQTASS